MFAAVACGEYASVEEAAERIVKLKATEEPDTAFGGKIRGSVSEIQEDLPGA